MDAATSSSFGAMPPPLPQEPSALDIEQMQEDLLVQKAIVTSLLENGQSESDESVLTAKAGVKRLAKNLSEAKRARHQNSATANPSSVMARGDSDHQIPSRQSGLSSPSENMSSGDPWEFQDLPTRLGKRTYSNHLDGGDRLVSGNKAVKAESSDMDDFLFRPEASISFFDDEDIIDLTGDDEYLKRQDAEMENYKKNKTTFDSDAELARQLVAGASHSRPSSASQYQQSGPSAFDRILSRSGSGLSGPATVSPPSHLQAVKPEPASLSAAAARYNPNSLGSPTLYGSTPGPKMEDDGSSPGMLYRMPGSFPLPLAEDPNDAGLGNPRYTAPLPYPGLPTPGLPAQPNRPSNYYSRSYSGGPPGSIPFGAPNPSTFGPLGTASHNGYAGISPSNVSLPLAAADRPGTLSGGMFGPWGTFSNPWDLAGPQYPNLPLGDLINRTSAAIYNPQWTEYLNDLENDPRKSEEEIKELLKNIRPDMDIPQEDREGTPDALRYPLYPHQQLALQWMKQMEEGRNKGGILADDMGLGKTISTLALMVSRPSQHRAVKTNLIVGPVALIRQWESEIQKKLKRSHNLSVFLLHGKKATFEDLRQYDVVLTTYGTIAQEWKRLETYYLQNPGRDFNNDTNLARKCPLLHGKSKWYRIILDEAQCIKNKDTQSAKGVQRLVGTHRWCLTGTPMMNGVWELFSLLRFLHIKPYGEWTEFNKAFGSLTPKNTPRISSVKQKDAAMQKLRVVLKAVMLRRMKNSEIDGKPILNLPPKTEEAVHVVFSEDEQDFYKTLEAKAKIQFNKYVRAGTVGKNYSNILVLLLRLRQAACHPHLNMDCESVSLGSAEDMIRLAKTMEPAVIARIKKAACGEEEEGFDCPICYDVPINPSILLPCGHDTCSDCLPQLIASARENNIRDGRDQDNDSAKCPECRQAFDVKTVIDFHAFARAHMPEKARELGLVESGDEGDLTDEDSETDSESEGGGSSVAGFADDDADERGNLRGFIVDDDIEDDTDSPKDEASPPKDEAGLPKKETALPKKETVLPKKETVLPKDEEDDASDEDFDTAVRREAEKMASREAQRKAKKLENRKKRKGKKTEKVQPHMLMKLRKEANQNQEARRRYMRYLRKNWEPSAKVTKACEILENLRQSGEKTIVFSVWTGLLDLLEIPIHYKLKMKFCRYDGGMSANARDQAARNFMEDPQIKVMLVSLKAGNAGLNLTAASQVIIMDPFWNPYIEMQAVDRAHRIGQQRPVMVHRILVEGTVEDRIIELQEKKRSLVESALDEGEAKSLGRLSSRELGFLFGLRT